MRWQAVLFDLDDTLYSRTEAFSRTVDRMAEVHVAPVTGEPVDVIADRIVAGTANWRPEPSSKKPPELIAEQVKSDYPAIQVSELSLTSWFEDELIAQIRPDPSLEQILSRLDQEQVPWCIVTNGNEFQLRKIEKLNIKIDMARIIKSDVEGWQKPDPRLFKLALDRVDHNSIEKVLMVGDNPVADIHGAQNAGLKAAWMSNGFPWSQVDFEPDIQLNSLSDLQNHLD